MQRAARAFHKRVALPSEIISADDTLSSVFMLLNPRESSAPRSNVDAEAKAAQFLLWFAVEGRHRYHHAIFSPAYVEFLRTPVPPYPSRLAAYVILSRPELKQIVGEDVSKLLAWYEREGIDQLSLQPFSAIHAEPRVRSDLPGCNVIGFGNSVMGLGEDARSLLQALQCAGVASTAINVDLPETIGTALSGEERPRASDRPIFPINVFTMPPFETVRLHVERGENLFHHRFCVGYWPWELSSLPEPCRKAFDLMDEIWAPSEFLCDVYRALTRKPVHHVRPHVDAMNTAAVDLTSYGIGEKDFVFLTMFDFNSFVARKNPQGAIEAFRRAFPSRGSERLVIKTINAHAHTASRRALESLCAGDERCIFVDAAFDRPKTLGLIARANCLISLHRAEGFGRVIAEAMLLNTDVVATNWSGNTSFMNQTNGYPVAYRLRDVRADEYVFTRGSQWAEPDIDDAIELLRRVRWEPDSGRRAHARTDVAAAYGIDSVVSALTHRIEEIGGSAGCH